MFFNIIAPNALLCFKFLMYLLYNLCKKCTCTTGRVEYLDFMHFLFESFNIIFISLICFLQIYFYFGFTVISQTLS